MIKPTVGRVVHFHPAHVNEMATVQGEPLAAIVSAVWSDTCVNLMVIDANGNTYSKTSQLLWQEGNPRPSAGFAEWMPYQTGQAAKTEKLQAQLDAK